MKIIDVDLKKEEQGTRLDVTAYSPTLGWSDVSLSPVVYFTPPIDGIQDVYLTGTPPEGNALTSIVVYPLSIAFPKTDWLFGVRIKNQNGGSLVTIRTPVTISKPIGDDWLAMERAGLKGDKLLVDVVYSGGCGQHSFQLNWDGDILKSSPPQIVLELSHNANGDTCKSLQSERLQFDLSVILDDTPESYVIRINTGVSELVAHNPG